MKKHLFVLLTLTTAISLSACNNMSNSDKNFKKLGDSSEELSVDDPKKRIGNRTTFKPK